jgi:hypothetical protein
MASETAAQELLLAPADRADDDGETRADRKATGRLLKLLQVHHTKADVKTYVDC